MVIKTKRKTYGNTWWGAEWVKAIEAMDLNRLKRGRSYANTNQVLHVSIDGCEIKSRVAGNYKPYYKVKIQLKTFEPQEQNKLKAIIESNPSLGLELGMGRLPEQLLKLSENAGLGLLPKSLDDLDTSCSCPDWGNPCKHRAATYYMIANEIDKDPLLLLKLRGFDTSSMAIVEGVDLVSHTVQLKSFEDTANLFVDPELTNLNREIGANIDYNEQASKILSWTFGYKSLIVNVLSDNPPFFSEGNFKEIVTELYDLVIKKSCLLLTHGSDKVADLKEESFRISFDPSARDYINSFEFLSYKYTLDTGELLASLLKSSININLDKINPDYRFVLLVTHFSFKLVQKGLFIPELIKGEDKDSFFVRYVPLIHSHDLKHAMKALQQLYPRDLCGCGDLYLPAEHIKEIISYIISSIIYQICKLLEVKSNNKLINCFSHGIEHTASDFHEDTVRNSLNNWLERLHIHEQNISPLIHFERAKRGFKLLINIINNSNPLSPIIQYSELSSSHRLGELIYSQPIEQVRTVINRQLVIASEYIRSIREIINSKGLNSPVVSLQEMGAILLQALPVLELLGVRITLPKELAKLARPQAQVKVNSSKNISVLNLHTLLNFSYQIALGDKVITQAEFLKLAKDASGLVKYKGQYLFLDPQEASNIIAKLQTPFELPKTRAEMMFVLLAGEINGIKIDNDKELDKLLKMITKEEKVSVPANLKADLRAYQERGFKWLYSNAKKSFGSCIADDMGLGKTLQIITLLLQYKNESKKSKPALVVCPTALISNWHKECARFAPDLKVVVYHGSYRKLSTKGIDLVLTSYGTFLRDQKKLSEHIWRFLIIDEAQNIKNTETKQTRAIKSLKADHYIAMTGTPVENRLSEMWSIMDFANRDYLGSLKQFNDNLAKPIESYKDPESVSKLKKITAPFLLRRLKTDKSIIQDLPDKIVQDDYCFLSESQAAIYENVVSQIMNEINDAEGIERKGLIFKLITALKQVCNHPLNFSKQGKPQVDQSGKSLHTVTLLENILANNEKTLIFTQYKEMGDLLVEMIHAELGTKPLFYHGSVSRANRDIMVDSFQKNLKSKIMIISLKAGGTGLNLTAASHVIHYDLWWNPAVENQATDRAFRIGQSRNVMVHRLITTGTFEEKINEIIKSKQELAELTVSSGESWITKMSNKELKEIFTLSK